MDRFIALSPSARKQFDSTFIRSFYNKSFTDKKSTPKPAAPDRRRSIRDETLLKLFSSQPDQPLNDENLNPVTLFRTFSMPEKASLLSPSSRKSSNSHLSRDYREHDENRSCQSFDAREQRTVANSKLRESLEERSEFVPMTPPSETLSPPAIAADLPFAKNKAIQQRLQRDLNSPSANARIRAIKALKDPANVAAAYANFDVPHEEQDIITTEERTRPKSIQEVMRDVVVYVEVRTGEDNRSAGVKKVISQLGARVNDKFLRDTTHVVFKDGLQSTYNKAKKWNIPVVSILWIEACKKHMILMNPDNYKISNYERYENPELHSKIKRQKSMQPEAEENVRRNKAKLAKLETADATKAVNRTIAIPRKPKNKLGEILADFQQKQLNTPEFSEDIPGLNSNSKLLEKIMESPYSNQNSTQRSKNHKKTTPHHETETNSDDDFEIRKPPTKTPDGNARKTLQFDKKPTPSSSKRRSITTTPTTSTNRRSTIVPSQTSRPAATSKATAKINIGLNISARHPTKSPYVTRRSIARRETLQNPTISNPDETNVSSLKKTVLLEESCDISSDNNNRTEKKDLNGKRRDTTYADVQFEYSHTATMVSEKTPTKKNSRQTQYSPKSMEKTCQATIEKPQRRKTCFNFSTRLESPDAKKKSPLRKPIRADAEPPIEFIGDNCPSIRKSVRRQTMYTTPSYKDESTHVADYPLPPTAVDSTRKKTLIEELDSSIAFNSTKLPFNRRRTVFDISLDIIEQRVKNINKSARLIRTDDTVDRDTDVTNKDQTIVQDEQQAATVDSFVNGLEKPDENKTSTRVETTGMTPQVLSVAKKRKLFAPVDLMLTPPPALSNDDSRTERNPRKKAKTDIKPIKIVRRTQSRRSSLDFEKVVKIRSGNKTVAATGEQKQQLLTQKPAEPKVKYIVCTNMHTEQMNCVKQAIETLGALGSVVLENMVTDKTTHVISLEPRRTFNLLRGIVRGVWILNYNWIIQSMEEGKWLFEEPYEMTNFSRAVEICRSQRQAFGPKYKLELFTDLGPIYVSSQSNVPSKNVEELVELCSGRVVKNKSDAKYILGESTRNNPEQICLNPIWILDSIQENKIKKLFKYILTSNREN